MTPGPSRPAPARSWAELTGAWALAIAWPFFQGVTSGSDALTLLRADRVDILIFTVVMVLIGPTLIWGAEMLIRLVSELAARVFHAGSLGFLFGLVVWQGLFDEMSTKVGVLLLALVALAIAAAYLKVKMVETMAGILSFAAPVTVLGFWLAGPAASVMLPHDSVQSGDKGNGTPVVLVVLDEFPVASLESAPGRIDARNFPGFASLAKDATWYRNAHTVADVTTEALPALVAGVRAPSKTTPPDFRQYPDNLFSLLDAAGYDVAAEESITDLCPHDVCADRGSQADRLRVLMFNGAVTGHPLPNQQAEKLTERFRPAVSQLEPSPRDEADTFIRTIPAGDSTVSFVHLLLPHIPWIYLPNGQDYLAPIAPGLLNDSVGDGDQTWSGPQAEIDSSFQRMQLQTSFLDHQIVRLVRQMKRQGIWDKALFAVVADHGESLETGLRRRYLDPENSGWVLPVPLFVKYPGQGRGRAVDRPVTSLDLLPTILANTGVNPPDDLEGSRLDRPGPSAKTIESSSYSTGETLPLDEKQVERRRNAAVRYRNRVFPDGSLYALAGSSGQLGKRVTEGGGFSPLEATFDPPWPAIPVDPSHDRLPAYVSGETDAELTDDTPLAIGLNGRLAGTFRTFPGSEPGLHRFSFTLPPELFRNGENEVALLRINE